MRGPILTVLFIFFTLSAASCIPLGNVRADQYRRCNPDEATCQESVTIFMRSPKGLGYSGSGVVVSSDGLILAEAHVIGEDLEATIQVCSEQKAKLNCEPAYLVAFDYHLDLALIQVPRHFNAVARLGSTAGLHPGSALYVISSPDGKFHQTLTSVQFEERGVFWEDYDTVIPKLRLKAATVGIAPGSSGGGVFDAEGRLVGVIQRSERSERHISYAIPVEVIRFFLENTRSCTGAPNACVPH